MKRLFVFFPSLAPVLLFPLCAWLLVAGPESYLTEMFSGLAPQAAWIFLLTGSALLLRRRLRSGFAASASGAVIFFHLLPWWLPPRVSAPATGFAIRVSHLSAQLPISDLLVAAANSTPDVLSLEAVTPESADRLEAALCEHFPWMYFAPRTDSFGLAVLSKVPLSDMQLHHWSGYPSLTGVLSSAGGEVHFAAVTTASPASASKYESRSEHLRQTADWISRAGGPALLIGNFRSVPWSAMLRRFCETTALQNSGNITFALKNWFAPASVQAAYILHSRELFCVQFSGIRQTQSELTGISSEFTWIPEKQLACSVE